MLHSPKNLCLSDFWKLTWSLCIMCMSVYFWLDNHTTWSSERNNSNRGLGTQIKGCSSITFFSFTFNPQVKMFFFLLFLRKLKLFYSVGESSKLHLWKPCRNKTEFYFPVLPQICTADDFGNLMNTSLLCIVNYTLFRLILDFDCSSSLWRSQWPVEKEQFLFTLFLQILVVHTYTQ